MYLSAFILGISSGLHCIGMCGPISMMIPLKNANQFKRLLLVLAYNVMRISVYGVLGYLFGLLGRQLNFANWQQSISIAFGTLMLVSVLYKGFSAKFDGITNWYFTKIVRFKNQLINPKNSGTLASTLSLGLINGLLPCGMVYMGLAFATILSSAWHSAAFMVVFGFGTLPLMIAMPFVFAILSGKWRSKLNKAIPIIVAIFGILLILRGLDLGIPYLSPILGFIPQASMCN